MLTLSYGGVTFTYPNLGQHPLGFEAADVQRGKTAEALNPTTLLLKPQTDALIGLFRAWRDVKLAEEPPERTGVVGATVAVTSAGPGFSWSNRACWFREAPSCEQVGPFTRVSLSLVDATQALAIKLREIEEGLEDEQALNLGTLSLGTATINLTARPNSYDGLPQAELSPAGAHVISGQLVLEEIREVRGWVTAANLANLETWLTTTVATTPAPNAWFPRAWTTPVAVLRPNGGAVSVVYDVALTLVRIRG